jgi:hypothetical protein
MGAATSEPIQRSPLRVDATVAPVPEILLPRLGKLWKYFILFPFCQDWVTKYTHLRFYLQMLHCPLSPPNPGAIHYAEVSET